MKHLPVLILAALGCTPSTVVLADDVASALPATLTAGHREVTAPIAPRNPRTVQDYVLARRQVSGSSAKVVVSTLSGGFASATDAARRL